MFRIFGFEPGVAPSLADAMARIHPDDRLMADDDLERDMAGESRPTARAVRVLWPTGELRFVEGKNTTLKNSIGEVIAVIGAVVDVTDRKRSETDLLRAKEAAERAMAEKSAFVANVTHELRTPLTSIIGYANLLGKGGPEDRRRLKHFHGASRTLLSIVNNLLDFSRIEEGRARFTPVAFSPRDLAQECLDLFVGVAEERGLCLRFDAADNLPDFLTADPDALRQVMVNLIGNAVKFTDSGWISLALTYSVGSLRLTVEDSGCGLDPLEIDRLFRRYERARSHQDQKTGAGLGLAISKGLVEAMGGTICASNRPSGGARFVCEIPAELASAAGLSSDPIGLSGARVLVADDNASIREISRCILEAAGAEVFEAEDGLSAIALASSETFDILLIDLNMPGISGSEVVRYLRSLGLNRAATIVAFTASGGVSAADMKAQGFDGAFFKPIDPVKLIALVHESTRALRAA